MKPVLILCITVLMLALSIATPVIAADSTTAEGAAGVGTSIKYFAAALAVGLCAIATGIAQSRIGAAGMGAIVEKPDTIGTVIICLAIPETMVILGFVVAAMIIIL